MEELLEFFPWCLHIFVLFVLIQSLANAYPVVSGNINPISQINRHLQGKMTIL